VPDTGDFSLPPLRIQAVKAEPCAIVGKCHTTTLFQGTMRSMTSENNKASVPTLTLNYEREIPQIGLGTYKLRDDECIKVVGESIEVGYSHFDNDTVYMNEVVLGKALNDAIAAGDVTRDELFVNSKVWHDHHGVDKVREAFQTSLDKLGFD